MKERNKKFTCCKNTFPKFNVTHSSIKTFILSLLDVSARNMQNNWRERKGGHSLAWRDRKEYVLNYLHAAFSERSDLQTSGGCVYICVCMCAFWTLREKVTAPDSMYLFYPGFSDNSSFERGALGEHSRLHNLEIKTSWVLCKIYVQHTKPWIYNTAWLPSNISSLHIKHRLWMGWVTKSTIVYEFKATTVERNKTWNLRPFRQAAGKDLQKWTPGRRGLYEMFPYNM